MQREIKREKLLPAFVISIDELEMLFNKLTPLFDTSDEVRFHIRVNFPSEVLSFNNITELRSYSGYYKKTNKFSLSLRQNNKIIFISDSTWGGLWADRSKVIAESDNEAWSAGAIETAYSFIVLRRAWFHLLSIVPIWAGTMIFGFTLLITDILFNIYTHNKDLSRHIFIIGLIVAFLIWAQPRVFPASTLVFSQEESFIRRYGVELGLLLTVVVIIISLVK